MTNFLRGQLAALGQLKHLRHPHREALAMLANPPSVASVAAFKAIASVTLALSMFCAIEAVICSIEALICSTPATCSLKACYSDCAVALTCSEAAANALAPLFTLATTVDMRATISSTAAYMLVWSLGRVLTSTVKSPSATRSSNSVA